MKRHLKLPLLVVVVLMVLSLISCSSGTIAPTTSTAPSAAVSASASGADASAPAATTEVPKELYKVTALSLVANYAGDQPGWYAKVLKDKFNMQVSIEAPQLEGGDAKFATKLVSGDLGDIVIFGDKEDDFKQAVDAGLLLDWTQNGLLDQYGKDITANYSAALDKNKQQYGGGSAIYGIGHDCSTTNEGPGEVNDFTWGPYLRWDLYAKLNYPKIDEMEGYLPVLKQMQQLEPKTPDGKPVYAFSFWKDWDGSHMMNAKQFACMHGYNDDTGGLLLIHASEDKYQDLLQPDGYYLRTLKMYYDANKMGLVDPDSPTQNWDTMYAKATNGQVLFSWFSFVLPYNTKANKDAGRGMMLVPFTNEEVYSYGLNLYGGQRITSIGAKAKYPERIMQYIDWLCTPDGIMTNSNGPEGLTWNYKDGKAELTDLGLKIRDDQKTTVPEEWGGGAYTDGNNKFNYEIVNPSTVNPQTSEPYNQNGWSSVLNLSPTKVDTEWRAKMGATTSIEWFEKNGKIAIYKPTEKAVDTNLSDELKQKLDQVSSIIKEYSWNMVFAKDDATYNKLQQEMITKAKGLGYDDIVAAQVKMAQQMFELRKQG